MSFDLSRLRRCDLIVGAGALALLVFLFGLQWYGGSAMASIGGLRFTSSANGWHAFTDSRWIWILTIALTLSAVALRAARREPYGQVQPGVLIAGFGGLSTILIVYRILHHPVGGASVSTIGGVHYSYSYGIKVGIWLGLIAAAAIAYGGYLAMRAEGSSLASATPSGPESAAAA
jgi:hypothetical protein